MIFRVKGLDAGGSPETMLPMRRQAAGALGIIASMGAFGGFAVPIAYAWSKSSYGSIQPALQFYLGFFLLPLVVTWVFYLRPGSRMAQAGVEADRGAVTAVHITEGPAAAGSPEGPGAAGSSVPVPADLVVLACGIRPETELARRSGLTVDRGVLVDDTFTTSDPTISAIGDCAQVGGEVAGLVAPAWEQARVVAARLTGDKGSRYAAPPPLVRLKARGLDVLAAGLAHTPVWTDEPGLDVVQLTDAAGGRYVKAVLRDGLVVGAVSVGAPPVGGRALPAPRAPLPRAAGSGHLAAAGIRDRARRAQ